MTGQPPRRETRNTQPLSDHIEETREAIQGIEDDIACSLSDAIAIFKCAQEAERMRYWVNDLDVRDAQIEELTDVIRSLPREMSVAYEAISQVLKLRGG